MRRRALETEGAGVNDVGPAESENHEGGESESCADSQRRGQPAPDECDQDRNDEKRQIQRPVHATQCLEQRGASYRERARPRWARSKAQTGESDQGKELVRQDLRSNRFIDVPGVEGVEPSGEKCAER